MVKYLFVEVPVKLYWGISSSFLLTATPWSVLFSHWYCMFSALYPSMLCKTIRLPYFKRRVSLGWFGSGLTMKDFSDHGASKEPTNLCPEWIRQFLWCTTVQVMSNHCSGSWSSQRNASLDDNTCRPWIQGASGNTYKYYAVWKVLLEMVILIRSIG